MTPSATITSFIKGFEKCRLKAYTATDSERADNIWTIGYGHIAGVRPNQIWTQAQADEAFVDDILAFSTGVAALLGKAKTTQNQFDAMVSLAFNIGLGAFKTSSVLTNHLAGHYQTAQWAFSLWNKQRDKYNVLQVVTGLTRRRAAEALIYKGVQA